MKLELERQNNAYHFIATNETGQQVSLDASPAIGGEGRGVRAMEVVAIGLGHCSSVDILSILKKQKQEVADYDIDITAERAEEETPAVFKDIHLHFRLTGEVEPHKAQRAIELSLGKYCSVARMLEKTAAITYSLTINGVDEATDCTYE